MKTILTKSIAIAILLQAGVAFNVERVLCQEFSPQDIRLGDPSVSYVNHEISPIGDFMIWLEVDTSNGVAAKVWHCKIDPRTGDLIPADGKGFSGFTSNIYGRPTDWGRDSKGVYYAGTSFDGGFVVVRPIDERSGQVERIGSTKDIRRRVVYPSQLPNLDRRFITYIVNDNEIGGANNPANNTYELRCMDLDKPDQEILIERQSRVFPQFAGMDIIVPRWLKGSSRMTYGFKDQFGLAQVKEFDALNPDSGSLIVTNDRVQKVDGFPAVGFAHNGTARHLYFSGINNTDTAYYYARETFGQVFKYYKTVVPKTSNLRRPALNQSHEHFIVSGQSYSAFQINNQGKDFFATTFYEPGEIWMSVVDSTVDFNVLLSTFDPSLNVLEPEPYVSAYGAWVYYSATPYDTTVAANKKISQLRRCATPIAPTSAISETNHALAQLRVFPNPATDRARVVPSTSGTTQYELVWSNGQREILEVNSGVIDVTHHAPGLYYIVERTPNAYRFAKFVISR